MTADDFEIRVRAEVELRLVERGEQMQRAFEEAVADKVSERIDDMQGTIDNLKVKLAAAEKAAAATAASTPAPEAPKPETPKAKGK